MTDSIQEQHPETKKEPEKIRAKTLLNKVPWHASVPIVISAVAFLFSFGTTAISFRKENQENIRVAHNELRGILQRLTSIQKENFELASKYGEDPRGADLSGLLNQENSLLARQASEIVDRFPDEISASEYYSVSMALMQASDSQKVAQYLDRAIAQKCDPNVKVASLRAYGTFAFGVGQAAEGRLRFEQALLIWNEYPTIPQYFKDFSDAFTEMVWAQAELGFNEIELARVHIRKAFDRANSLPPSQMRDQVGKQVQRAQRIVEERKQPPPSLRP